MLKIIDGQTWFCCPQCGQKLHPVKPGARGVFAVCKGKRGGVKCNWSGEINWGEGVKASVPVKTGAGYY